MSTVLGQVQQIHILEIYCPLPQLKINLRFISSHAKSARWKNIPVNYSLLFIQNIPRHSPYKQAGSKSGLPAIQISLFYWIQKSVFHAFTDDRASLEGSRFGQCTLPESNNR